MSVYRVYVEKKPEYAVEAKGVFSDCKTALQLDALRDVRILNRYDVEGITEEVLAAALPTVFSEPPVDVTYGELPDTGADTVFASEYLPGQFDQRADSCEQCIQLMTQGERPTVRTARIYLIFGKLTAEQLTALKRYLINPVESREASLDTVDSLAQIHDIPTTVKTLEGFTKLSKDELADFIAEYGLAMDLDDILFCQQYFGVTEHRDPTITEIRMIDTYWSDHCRHTTFSTHIHNITIEDKDIEETYNTYLDAKQQLHRENKPMTLMEMATIAARKLKADGKLTDLDESEEINACSVRVKVDIDGQDEDWLLMFKNETHNHPTEIEPFGGAATCLGGAIRDPLSGRSYVYQAMRVTGAANPLTPIHDTIPGKLPQKKITLGAAEGYSSYGNQIGLATGHVSEVYHPGYVAKRMEIGAVIAAAPAENVIREVPEPGDVVILLGGKTGRDGCGGATGSSKSHTVSSITSCGAEVQKGNAPEERKLQRLFRNPKVAKLIRRCNDFGAGGVSVAIGELADGLSIDLNAVPKKYDGLDGTELAISESQERMAVVVRAKDADEFTRLAGEENLLATKVAVVTEEPRLLMTWNGQEIVDVSRDFLNSNGAPKNTDIVIPAPKVAEKASKTDCKADWLSHLSELNICSQKGLSERFDSTIGAGTVLMPFGGKTQLSPMQGMVAKLPVLHGETDTASVMAWGFHPYLSENSPYHGAVYAVLESVAKVVAAGGSAKQCWLTFQEYFERTQNNPQRWGKPAAALLGALQAQLSLGIASIGGKDSMSGTFEDIDVPPTLVSFAVSMTKASKAVSSDFKAAGDSVVLLLPNYHENGLPDYDSVLETWAKAEELISSGKVSASWALSYGGVAEGIAKMGFGNRVGFTFSKELSNELLFFPVYGGLMLEVTGEVPEGLEVIGTTANTPVITTANTTVTLDELLFGYESKLEPIFPYHTCKECEPPKPVSHTESTPSIAGVHIAKPRVLIPVFPGTNCEYDTARAFEKAGAIPQILVLRNLKSSEIDDSVRRMTESIRNSQIIMIPGGFSGGDEPEGSAKFINAFFRNPSITEAVHELLKQRDGLMLGICNGFQALIKLGLVPYGEIVDATSDSATLTFNTIGRHQSMMVNTRVCSNLSPWLSGVQVGDIHTVPISHGEGRFVAPPELIAKLVENGQVATQYVDLNGNPTYDIRFNPNNSVCAIEGITSPDGRVLGKMAHSERAGTNIGKNVPGNKDQKIFASGVAYFM